MPTGDALVGHRITIKDSTWGYANTGGVITSWDGRYYIVDVGGKVAPALSRDEFVVDSMKRKKKGRGSVGRW